MPVLTTILIIILLYFLVAFLIPIFILPNYLLFKPKHKITNPRLKQVIKKLNKIKNKEKFAKAAFLYVTRNYHPSDPITFLFHLPKLFWHNQNKIIESPGFAYCHVQNLMLKTILLESKRFKQPEIKTKINFTTVLHQYLQVKIKNNWVEMDPWGYRKGIPFGKHLNTISFLKITISK